MPCFDSAQPFDHDADVERHHERDERLGRHVDPQLAPRLFEGRREDSPPLFVHARETLPKLWTVPGERL